MESSYHHSQFFQFLQELLQKHLEQHPGASSNHAQEIRNPAMLIPPHNAGKASRGLATWWSNRCPSTPINTSNNPKESKIYSASVAYCCMICPILSNSQQQFLNQIVKSKGSSALSSSPSSSRSGVCVHMTTVDDWEIASAKTVAWPLVISHRPW